MAEPKRDRRPPLAVATDLAYQAVSICILMALPAGLGYWGDQRLGTSPLLVIVGAVLGLASGMMQLMRLAGGMKRSKRNHDQHGSDGS